MTGVKWSARKGTARRNREESRLGSVLLLADPEKLGEAGTWQETDRGTVPAVLVQGMDPEHPRAAGKAWRNGSGGPGAGDGSGASQGGGESLEDRSRDASLESYSKIYPQAARASGEEGTAQVGVEISAGGEVLSAWLESSTGYDRLDRAALKSARQWTFSPALDAAGHPVPSRKSVTVVYSLTE